MVLQFWQHVSLNFTAKREKEKEKPNKLNSYISVTIKAKYWGTVYLLFHFLNLLYRAASLVFVLHSNAEDLIPSPYLLLFLFLGLFQLALGTDALRVVHVVGLHHLELKREMSISRKHESQVNHFTYFGWPLYSKTHKYDLHPLTHSFITNRFHSTCSGQTVSQKPQILCALMQPELRRASKSDTVFLIVGKNIKL